MVESSEVAQKSAEEIKRKNWADEEDDDNDEGQDQEIGDAKADAKQAQEKQEQEEETKKEEEVKPTWKMADNKARERNQYGDFVVKKFEVRDPRENAKKI